MDFWVPPRSNFTLSSNWGHIEFNKNIFCSFTTISWEINFELYLSMIHSFLANQFCSAFFFFCLTNGTSVPKLSPGQEINKKREKVQINQQHFFRNFYLKDLIFKETQLKIRERLLRQRNSVSLCKIINNIHIISFKEIKIL